MRKKFISLMMILGLCILAIYLLEGCGHEHTWNEGEWLNPPSLTQEGIIEYTCTTCLKTKKEVTKKQTLVTPTWKGENNVYYDGANHSLTLNFPQDYQDNITIHYYYNDIASEGVSDVGTYQVTAVINNLNPYVYLESDKYEATLTISKKQINILSLTIAADSIYWVPDEMGDSYTVKIVDATGKNFEKTVDNTTTHIAISDISGDISEGSLTAYVKTNGDFPYKSSSFWESESYNYIKGPHCTLSDTTSYRLDTVKIFGKVTSNQSQTLATQAEEYQKRGFAQARITYSITVEEDSGWTWLIGNSSIDYWLCSSSNTDVLFDSKQNVVSSGTGTYTVTVAIADLIKVNTLRLGFENVASGRGAKVTLSQISITYIA